MSPELSLLVAAGAVLVVAAVSGRLDRLWLSEPLLATVLGLGVAALVGGVFIDGHPVVTILELTLALVLFTDASRIDVTRLREGFIWPVRILAVGLPLAIALGAGVAGWHLGLPLGLSLLVGVALAPTDAALAEPVLDSSLVPPRVRQTINVESGLNDGLAVPVLILALAIIGAEDATVGSALGVIVSQLGIGVVGGVALGWLGAVVIGRGAQAGWMNPLHQKIAAVSLALAGFAAVQLLGGSGFVATFVAGGLMSHLVRPRCEYLYDFAEAEGHTLVLLAFFVFGLGPVYALFTTGVPGEAWLVAITSLFVLRPLSVGASLLGQGLGWRTIAFLGWFGPRGLATVVFLLLASEDLGALDPRIVATVNLTVVLSVVAHGVTAVPLSEWLSRHMTGPASAGPEMGEAFDHPMRRSVSRRSPR